MAKDSQPSRTLTTPVGAPHIAIEGDPFEAAHSHRTLVDIFEATVAVHGNCTAIDARDASLTYTELYEAANDLADSLRELNIGCGDRVGIRVSSGTTDLYIGILGTLFSGAAYVPVDRDDSDERAAIVWQEASVCLVVTDGLAFITDGLEPARCTNSLSIKPSLDDDAWVIFTSGSTGTPKGVAVSHRAAGAFVDAESQLFKIATDDRVLAGLSVAFDASCEEMWLAWRNGAALVPAPREIVRSGIDFGPWLARNAVSVVSTVPSLAALWEKDHFHKIRLVILGGEACPPELGWELATSCEVWNTYGPTEAAVVTTAGRIYSGEPISIGRPLIGWKTAVVDGEGELVEPGEAGELLIAGVGLGRYLDPALDAQCFAPALGWERVYRSGDIVRDTGNGLEFVGRSDDQVKLGGRRLELGEIESYLVDAPGVIAAAAAVKKTEAGNSVLVGYVTGDVEVTDVGEHVAPRLPVGITPLIIRVDEFPLKSSGKLDRAALPWPPPSPIYDDEAQSLEGTAVWLAEQWRKQLGPVALTYDSNFFSLGGTSLAAAKLISVLRERFPAVAVRDLYDNPTLKGLASRLDHLGEAKGKAQFIHTPEPRRWHLVQMLGVMVLFTLASAPWLVAILAFNDWQGAPLLPRISWWYVIVVGLLVMTAPGRAGILLMARWLLLGGGLKPGRYPRRSWLGSRVWFLERLAEQIDFTAWAGTPWANQIARLLGHQVGAGARLATIPQLNAIIRIDAGATIEADVDFHGAWVEGNDLVVGEIHIGAGARIGARALLAPGSSVGEGAEVEPGSLVTEAIPAGERWAGSPARCVGVAGERWPKEPAPLGGNTRFWRIMFGLGLLAQPLIVLVPVIPIVVVIVQLGLDDMTSKETFQTVLEAAPLIAILFVVGYALVVAIGTRLTALLIKTGWQSDQSSTGWALWFSGALQHTGRAVLFPLFASIYTRTWLRLAGMKIAKRTEVSTAIGLNKLVRLGSCAFVADDVVFSTARARNGWLHVAPITVGSNTFLGNGAVLQDGTTVGDDSLVGVLTTPPHESRDGTSWLGLPPIELPRVKLEFDTRVTTNPPLRLILCRAMMDIIRIFMPATVSVLLADAVYLCLVSVGDHFGLLGMILSAPFVLFAIGLFATALTIFAKWMLMGRYRAGVHPLWSFFVWRDEIINSCQEQLASQWLLHSAMGTALVPLYLRCMGAKVGRDVWCDTLALTEYDMTTIEDGCAINRRSCIETHLFHDRVLDIGPCELGVGSTLGPMSAVLPETKVGSGTVIGGRSVLLRGESLPQGTRWQGIPVVSE